MEERIKILIADDMKMIAEDLKKFIQKNDQAEVIGIANDGQEEYEMIKKLEPDLVFTDNQMPKLNGIDVIDLIKKSEDIKSPEFVIITGDRDIELIKKANSLNVMRLLNKPIDYSAIQDIITEFELINSKNPIPEQNKEDITTKESFLKTIIKRLKGKED